MDRWTVMIRWTVRRWRIGGRLVGGRWSIKNRTVTTGYRLPITDPPGNPSWAGRKAGARRSLVGRGRGDAPQLHQTAERWIEPMKAGPIRGRRYRAAESVIEPRKAALGGGRRHRTEEGDIERKKEGPARRRLGEGGACHQLAGLWNVPRASVRAGGN